MRVKNLIITALLMTMMLMLTQCASALYLPLPVNGALQGINVANQNIDVTNVRSGITMSTTTTGSGEFLVDWANSDDLGGTISKYMNGDVFQIKITACSSYSSACTYSMTYTGQSELYHVYDLTGVTLSCPSTSCPSCSSGGSSGGSCYVPFCNTTKDCKACPISSECPVTPACPEVTCPVPEAQPCFDKQCTITECKDVCTKDGGAGGVIMAIIGGLIAGGAGVYFTKGNNKLKVFKDKNGVEKVNHQHPGISGYHDPNTTHIAILIKHKKGELLPKYEKDSSGDWQYIGE
jgi:hypothetical protein